jgi:hypothetical protein
VRWETSPCGKKIFYDSFSLYAFGEKFNGNSDDYFDDGERVWKRVTLCPTKAGELPKESFCLVMERNPKSCQEWIKKTGIDLRNK